MNKNNYSIYLELLCFMISIFILLFILTFKPYYRVEINDIFLGYYKSQEEYKNYFNKITNEKYENEYEVIKYFSKEPYYKKVYVKNKYVEQFNNYELIEKKG